MPPTATVHQHDPNPICRPRHPTRRSRLLDRPCDALLVRPPGVRNYLYVTIGNEPRLQPSLDRFFEILSEAAPAGARWSYQQDKSESHLTMIAATLSKGLRAFFADAP